MRLQRITQYLLQHRWQAMVLTFLITYIPVLGMSSILIAGLMTLCVGIAEGALFTLVATLPYALVFITGMQETVPLVVWATVVLTILGNVLTWVFAVLLRKHWSWSQIVQVAALFGVLVISVIHLVYPNIAEWWGTQLQLFYNQSSAVTGGMKVEPQTLGEAQLDTINVIKNYAAGIVTAFVLLTSVMQVIIARWWQVTCVNLGKLGKELQYIHLTRLAAIFFLFSIVCFYLENSVVLDILPVLCLLFSAAGLSLIHYLCGLMEPAKGRFWLSILYVALMYSLVMIAMLPLFTTLGWALPVMTAVFVFATCIFSFILLGWFDAWFDVRKRVRKV
jgi:hypothetical protein